MESQPGTLTGAPPRLINSVIAGFNTVASHIHLILIPVALDLFIWFGPHLRISELFQPFMKDWLDSLAEVGTAEMTQLFGDSRQFFQAVLDQFNLFGAIRTWPIGVPSLMASLGEMATPLGKAPITELHSLASAFFTWLGILTVGNLLGVLYFNAIAYWAADHRPSVSLVRRLAWTALQTLALTVILVVGLVALSIPAVLILTVASMISPGVAQFLVLAMGFVLLWSLMPLVFAPHGIYAYGMNAVAALMTSSRLVRRFLPGASLFVLVAILLSEGLDVVWRAAPSDSWMTLVGIAGHAFITTALLAASFIYYQGGMRWMNENIQQVIANRQKA